MKSMNLLYVLLVSASLCLTSAGALSGSLDGYLYDTRPIVLFTSSTTHPKFQEQLGEFSMHECDLYERDIEVLTVVNGAENVVDGALLSNEEVSFLKDELEVGPHSELLVLVGKDGRVKLRAHMPLETAELIRLIDLMPTRRIERATRPQVHCTAA